MSPIKQRHWRLVACLLATLVVVAGCAGGTAGARMPAASADPTGPPRPSAVDAWNWLPWSTQDSVCEVTGSERLDRFNREASLTQDIDEDYSYDEVAKAADCAVPMDPTAEYVWTKLPAGDRKQVCALVTDNRVTEFQDQANLTLNISNSYSFDEVEKATRRCPKAMRVKPYRTVSVQELVAILEDPNSYRGQTLTVYGSIHFDIFGEDYEPDAFRLHGTVYDSAASAPDGSSALFAYEDYQAIGGKGLFRAKVTVLTDTQSVESDHSYEVDVHTDSDGDQYTTFRKAHHDELVTKLRIESFTLL